MIWIFILEAVWLVVLFTSLLVCSSLPCPIEGVHVFLFNSVIATCPRDLHPICSLDTKITKIWEVLLSSAFLTLHNTTTIYNKYNVIHFLAAEGRRSSLFWLYIQSNTRILMIIIHYFPMLSPQEKHLRLLCFCVLTCPCTSILFQTKPHGVFTYRGRVMPSHKNVCACILSPK